MNKFQTWDEQMDMEVDEPQALLADRFAMSIAKANPPRPDHDGGHVGCGRAELSCSSRLG